ncbi:hypothetical protein LINGRAHAP2_LOCUS11570 [Linum grandiflorum]
MVGDLFIPSLPELDKEQILDMFNSRDAAQILNLPIYHVTHVRINWCGTLVEMEATRCGLLTPWRRKGW